MEWHWEKHDIFSSKKLKSSEYIDRSFNLSGVVKVDSNSSIESSFKGGMEELSVSSEVSRSFHKPYSYMNGSSPSLEASVCSSDQSVGLKLGKRTPSSLKVKISCVPDVKKVKLLHQSTAVMRCQVEGCSLDLSSAKEYYKKHQVCENHSKSSKVVLGGVERRFCQQCSRFHVLSEFDGKKRSCRQRLSDHNARRRKPQKEKETIHFNSRNGRQQISFVSNNVPDLAQTTHNSQHTAGVFHKEAYRALSLLSNNSWGSCESDFSALDQPMQANGTTMAQHGMHSAHHNLSPEYWQADPHIQESHILKEPYGYY